jgi:hypothetical protein
MPCLVKDFRESNRAKPLTQLRGITMGLMHAVGTVEVARQHLDDPVALALAQDSMIDTSDALVP